MSNDALLWNAPRPKAREPVPGEPLWMIERDGKRIECEVRDHGDVGSELQVFVNQGFRSARLYPSRATALTAAEALRKRMSAGPSNNDG